MKKKLFLITASIATGVIGSIIFKKKKKTTAPRNESFIGDWVYYRKNKEKVILTVTPNFELHIRGSLPSAVLLQLTFNRLVFIDQMGYEMIFEQRDNRFHFYDEAEDAFYELTKKKD